MRFPTERSGLGWMTIPEMLERSAEAYRDELALSMRGKEGFRRFTYGELFDIVKRLALRLKDLGLKKGDRASVVGENRPEWAMAYLAIHWAGGVAVPLDPKLTVHEWKHIIQDAEVKVVISSGKMVSDFLDIKEDLKTLKHVISMDDNGEAESLGSILERYKKGAPRPDTTLEDLAVILYTSGTTGTSKGVMLTHKNIMSNVDAVYQCIYYGPGDKFFSVLPVHHVFEATAGFLTPLYGGAAIVYARSLKPRDLREDLIHCKPTVMLVVPLLLEKILGGLYREIRKASPVKKSFFYLLKGASKALKPLLRDASPRILFKSVRDKMGFGNLRYMVSGGAALPVWVGKGMRELGFPLLQGYGLSETSPVLTLTPPSRPKLASVGLPIPYVEIKIFNPDDNGVGEIAAKGPNIMKGYYKNEEATREVLTEDGWLLTGDLGYIDEEGFLYITGRKKSVIVTRGGKNIYPEEVENVLLQSPYIEEVLVLKGINPTSGDEEIQAIVYPNYEKVDSYFSEKGISNPSEDDVLALISQEVTRLSRRLAPYKRPRRITLREEEFPKTTTRKIKRFLFEKPSKEIREK